MAPAREKEMRFLKAVALFAISAAVHAQGYPDKPVKVVNAFAAGGGSDILLRTFLPKWSELLGQQIVVDYRTGAGGNVAMEAVAKSPPDGYTLLMGSPGLAINPACTRSCRSIRSGISRRSAWSARSPTCWS